MLHPSLRPRFAGNGLNFEPWRQRCRLPRQLSASSLRRPSARASWDNSAKSASSSAETMVSRWSSKSEKRALLVMSPVAIGVCALRAARSDCRLTGSHRAARSCAGRRALLGSGTPRGGPAAARRSGTSRCGQRHHAAAPRRASTELQRGKDVLALQVRVISEQLVDRHARRQQLEQILDGVAQPPDRRLPVADRGIRRNALKPGHAENDTSPESARLRGRRHASAYASECRGRAPTSIASGISIVNVDPCTVTNPPWRSTIAATIARPSPDPGCSAAPAPRQKRSNRCS